MPPFVVFAAIIAIANVRAVHDELVDHSDTHESMNAAGTVVVVDGRSDTQESTNAAGIAVVEESTKQVSSNSLQNDFFIEQIKAMKPELFDVILVTEGGDFVTEAAHFVIRLTSGGELSHVMIISQVEPLMVLEAVSNVDEGDPRGVRNVEIKKAFHKVTKFALLRKKKPVFQGVGGGAFALSLFQAGNNTQAACSYMEEALDWGLSQVGKPYATINSWFSVGPTPGRPANYNEEISNEPQDFYCSQLVAYVLYKAGCAFDASSNLNVDPEELRRALVDSYSYGVKTWGPQEFVQDGRVSW